LRPELDDLELVRQQAALFLEGRIDARKDALQLDMPFHDALAVVGACGLPSSSCSIEYRRWPVSGSAKAGERRPASS